MEILRIVRLSFEKDNVDDFIKIFINTKIRSDHLRVVNIWNSSKIQINPMCFTLSKWESEEALEYYRRSTLLKRHGQKPKFCLMKNHRHTPWFQKYL